MYKLLLCWRYLRTRYIALASIISVMLGVATMIVVNAVMDGFTHEMKDRIHGILSDLVFESQSLDGFPDADRRMAEIRKIAGENIAGMSPTINIPAMLGYSYGSQYVTKQITMIGVDEATYASVSDFGNYLQHPDNRKQLDFKLKEGGYDTWDHQASDRSKAPTREGMQNAGWEIRRRKARYFSHVAVPDGSLINPFSENKTPSGDAPAGNTALAGGPAASEGTEFDPAKDQHTGCVLGIGLCGYRMSDGADGFLAFPGDDVEISYPTSSKPPKVLSAKFTCVDFYESKMNEFDSNFVFVPIKKLQELRGMIDPSTGIANCNAINIRLKPGVDLDKVRDLLRANFPPQLYRISSWKDKQGALLAAVQMETAVLNVLLFLIIAVAGFGILAIFFMIVFEKTRDIGILKSLGATGRGIMSIFLSYGLSLGVVGASVGLVLGLLFVRYINEIADVLGEITGQRVFDPSIYYFQKIPTIIQWWTVAWIVVGAMTIAVLASILPARRAARLHPVEALRYE
ncbi:MAG TPA: ABC transporter permease [Lacipirellulaceae bacterium]|jgi:lipoprotein-releasing system permease protein|nr:ABC transporter permease [Lacipirellulaceae bacterium]